MRMPKALWDGGAQDVTWSGGFAAGALTPAAAEADLATCDGCYLAEVLGGQDLGGQDLGGQDLGGQDLGGQDLGGQDLSGQDLGGLQRRRVSTSAVTVAVGGLEGRADVGRRVRWDLYLVE
jgi:hypothetical protein